MKKPFVSATMDGTGQELAETERGHNLRSLHAVGEAHAAAARGVLRDEDTRLHGRFSGHNILTELMGPSVHVEKIVYEVTQVAASRLTVVIQGETGTGKELVARAIHHASPRCRAPFIAVDCGAIPEPLLESELFGYERGAFTGADRQKMGYFQLADGGSLFLDEIVNLPLGTQAKLLRALQERVVQPLGGRRPIPVDVRIIATSNVSLLHEVRAGRFREDLYWRLNEFTIVLPALRERAGDIMFLVNRFIVEACAEFERPSCKVSREAEQLLLRDHWPGNVRQLRSVIRQAVLLSADSITPERLVGLVSDSFDSPAPTSTEVPHARSLKAIAASAVADAERQAISRALEAMNGNKSAVARLLGIDYKTLLLKLKRYGICHRAFETRS